VADIVYIQVRFLSVVPVKALRIRLTVHRLQDCLHLIQVHRNDAEEEAGRSMCVATVSPSVRPVSCRVDSVTFVSHNYTAHANPQIYFYVFSLVLPVMSFLLILNDKWGDTLIKRCDARNYTCTIFV